MDGAPKPHMKYPMNHITQEQYNNMLQVQMDTKQQANKNARNEEKLIFNKDANTKMDWFDNRKENEELIREHNIKLCKNEREMAVKLKQIQKELEKQNKQIGRKIIHDQLYKELQVDTKDLERSYLTNLPDPKKELVKRSPT